MTFLPEDAGRPEEQEPLSVGESPAGMPPETSEGVDAETGEGRKALSRDELYSRLEAVDDPEDEVVEPETPPQVEDQDDSQKPDEVAPTEEPSEEVDDPDAELPAEEPEQEPAAEEKLFGRVPNEEWEKLPPVTRDRINALKADRKKHISEADTLRQREPLAKYGETIIRFADQNKMSDDDMEVLLGIGTQLQQGGDTAKNAALDIARHFGWEEQTSSTGPSKLPDWLQEKVDSLEMTEEAAHDVLQRSAPPKKEPAAQPQPRFSKEEELLQIGRTELSKAQAETQQANPAEWGTLKPEVEREMLKHKGADPRAWNAIWRSCVDVVKERRKAARRKQPIEGGMGNGHGNQRATVDPETLTGRDRLLAKYTRARPGT